MCVNQAGRGSLLAAILRKLQLLCRFQEELGLERKVNQSQRRAGVDELSIPASMFMFWVDKINSRGGSSSEALFLEGYVSRK